MRRIVRLAVAFLREHPVRLLLTSVATIASSCMVIWVASSYDSLLLTFDEYANKALGRYQLSVAPIGTTDDQQVVPPEVLHALRADPAVDAVDPMWAQTIAVRPNFPAGEASRSFGGPGVPGGPGGRPPEMGLGAALGPGGPGRGPGRGPGGGMGPPLGPPQAVLLGSDSAEPLFDLLRGRWLDPTHPEKREAVVSKDAADRFGADVGSVLHVGEGERAADLHIVGVIDVPVAAGAGAMATAQLLTPSVGQLFVPIALAEQLHGTPAVHRFVGVSVRPEADITRFRFAWAPRLSRFSPPVQFQEAHDIEEALDETASADNVRMQAYAATGIALLVALLVVLGTLGMGASERSRQLAMLRAITLTRAEVALLVAMEGLLLATIGFVGGVITAGLLLGLVAQVSSGLLRHGTVIGGHGILLAAVAAYGGAALAAVVPAWRATLVRPLDGMAPRPQAPAAAATVSLPAVLVGLALIAVNPLLTFVFPPAFEARVVLFMAIGFSTMALGFVLLAPAVVALVDRLAGPLLARLLMLDPRLLASQLTSNLWRTVGAALSMTVGMGLYIGIQVWGFTMLDSFVPGPWAPDALVGFSAPGLPPEEAAAVAALPGVDRERCLPVVVEQPRLREDLTRSAERASIVRQDNVVLVGIDLTRALEGERPLLSFDWVQGSPAEVVRRLEDGRGCIVPDHFLRETGLKLGDSFALVPPENPEHPVRYTIAGSVRLPGWHWQTKHTGFRPRTHRAAALVFAHFPTVARDFGMSAASHVWLSYASPPPDQAALAEGVRSLFSRVLQREVALGPERGDMPAVRVMPVEEIRGSVLASAQKWLWVVGRIPLIALLIAGFGVLNVILASVRARRWSMGVLRALGFTRWTLVRVVVAEGLLIGAVACVLSLGFGILAGWCGGGIAQYISFFGGMHPPLAIPWSPILRGLLAVLALSACAAAWPAWSTGKASPLTLLQQGRSAQ